MYVFGSGLCWWRGGEWMRGWGLGFINPVGTGEVLDVCLCFGCGGVGGVGGEWVGGLDQGLGWSCEFGFSVYMAGPCICILCLADTCVSEVHPVFNHVALYGYLLSSVYFNGRYRKSRLVCVCLSRHHPLLSGAAPAIQRVRMAGLPKNGKSATIIGGRRVQHNL